MELTKEKAELFYEVHGSIQDDSKGISTQDYEAAINAAYLMVEQAQKRIDSLDKAVCEEIENRDHWEERATKLANALGEYFDVSVGEHSSANCPINNAHELLNQSSQSSGFVVIAGKHDYEGMNCKYSSEAHLTLESAIKDYDRVSSYPWAYIEYDGRVLEVWNKDNHPLRD